MGGLTRGWVAGAVSASVYVGWARFAVQMM